MSAGCELRRRVRRGGGLVGGRGRVPEAFQGGHGRLDLAHGRVVLVRAVQHEGLGLGDGGLGVAAIQVDRPWRERRQRDGPERKLPGAEEL